MLVAIGAGRGDMGQFGAAGGLSPAGGQAQQAIGFDGDQGIEFSADMVDQVCLGFIGPVHFLDGQNVEGAGDELFRTLDKIEDIVRVLNAFLIVS
ncbi:hypothetical protein GRW89_26950 [Pseudomonas moraviensis]|nr:hypothetical protein [Pseudomonas moraviensis]